MKEASSPYAWKTVHDCIIVVVDAFKVDHEETIELLKYVSKNFDVPTIVVANKIDGPNDKEALHQIKELFDLTVDIFENFKRGPSTRNDRPIGKPKPKTAFVPLSAKNTFAYMKAGSIDPNHLNDPEYSDLVNRIGYNERGLTWTSMKGEEKIRVVRNILRDPSELDARLAGTNFTCLLSLLSEFVGGKTQQDEILAGQVRTQMLRLRSLVTTWSSGWISRFISDAFKKLQAIGKANEVDMLQDGFWVAYHELEDDIFGTNLEEDIFLDLDPCILENPYSELETYYYELASKLGWNNQLSLVYTNMIKLVRRQLNFLLERIQAWSLEAYCLSAGARKEGAVGDMYYRNKQPIKDRNCYRLGDLRIYWTEWVAPATSTWQNVSPKQWIYILVSLSLVWNQGRFVQLSTFVEGKSGKRRC